jgi:dolichol-phosphate mannosyltransferase
MSVSKLSVILPCHNEEANLPLWERELFPLLDHLPVPTEVLVIDDGSTDATRQAVAELVERRPSVRLLTHEKNRGLGAAVRTGFGAATGDAVVTLDADLTFAPSLIPPMLAALNAGADAVCASPFLGRFEGVGPVRRFLSLAANLCYRVLLGRPITAVTSLCRMYRRNKLQELRLASESFDINAEIILQLLRHGARVAEVPAVLTVRKFGVSKISTGREIRNHLRMFLRILRWRIRPA